MFCLGIFNPTSLSLVYSSFQSVCMCVCVCPLRFLFFGFFFVCYLNRKVWGLMGGEMDGWGVGENLGGNEERETMIRK